MATNVVDCLAGDARPRLREALEQTRPAMAALTEAELLPVNLNPFSAASLVRGAWHNLLRLKARIANELPNFDWSLLERLELYALALLQAQAVYQAVSGPPQRLAALSEEAARLRALLLGDTKALIHRGRLSASCLWGLKRRKGHRNVASDVLTLATLLRQNWSSIAGVTAVTEADLDRAEGLGDELVWLLGAQRYKPEAIAQAANDRDRAFTLLVRTYSEVRRVALFACRNQPDVARLVPSLFLKRGRRTRGELPEPVDTTTSLDDTTSAVDARSPAAAAAPAPAAVTTGREFTPIITWVPTTPVGPAATVVGVAPNARRELPVGTNGVSDAATAEKGPVPVGWPGAAPFIH